eukprot:SM000082S22870  [mRNA]  locus=s82:437577:442442:+ [translate_table: standard]
MWSGLGQGVSAKQEYPGAVAIPGATHDHAKGERVATVASMLGVSLDDDCAQGMTVDDTADPPQEDDRPEPRMGIVENWMDFPEMGVGTDFSHDFVNGSGPLQIPFEHRQGGTFMEPCLTEQGSGLAFGQTLPAPLQNPTHPVSFGNHLELPFLTYMARTENQIAAQRQLLDLACKERDEALAHAKATLMKAERLEALLMAQAGDPSKMLANAALPKGIRFTPTEHEVFEWLWRKIEGMQAGASEAELNQYLAYQLRKISDPDGLIPEVDLLAKPRPWLLPGLFIAPVDKGMLGLVGYFFVRPQYRTGEKRRRRECALGLGDTKPPCWKESCQATNFNELLPIYGTRPERRMFRFKQPGAREGPAEAKEKWKMYEYTLKSDVEMLEDERSGRNAWVICKVVREDVEDMSLVERQGVTNGNDGAQGSGSGSPGASHGGNPYSGGGTSHANLGGGGYGHGGYDGSNGGGGSSGGRGSSPSPSRGSYSGNYQSLQLQAVPSIAVPKAGVSTATSASSKGKGVLGVTVLDAVVEDFFVRRLADRERQERQLVEGIRIGQTAPVEEEDEVEGEEGVVEEEDDVVGNVEVEVVAKVAAEVEEEGQEEEQHVSKTRGKPTAVQSLPGVVAALGENMQSSLQLSGVSGAGGRSGVSGKAGKGGQSEAKRKLDDLSSPKESPLAGSPPEKKGLEKDFITANFGGSDLDLSQLKALGKAEDVHRNFLPTAQMVEVWNVEQSDVNHVESAALAVKISMLEEPAAEVDESKVLALAAEPAVSEQDAYGCPLYALEDLKFATADFANKILEDAEYGNEYLGTLNDGSVIVKKYGTRIRAPGAASSISHLASLKHPAIVPLMGCCPAEGCLMYKAVQGGSLQEHLRALDWRKRLTIGAEIAEALAYLHSRSPPVLHQKLKPSSVLLVHTPSQLSMSGSKLVPQQEQLSKLAFIGPVDLAAVTSPAAGRAGMQLGGRGASVSPYLDPDTPRTGVFGPASDVYSFGIILLQLLTGLPPTAALGAIQRAVSGGLESKSLASVLDREGGEWPIAQAFKVAVLALECTHMNPCDRPDLALHVLPVLQEVKEFAGASC